MCKNKSLKICSSSKFDARKITLYTREMEWKKKKKMELAERDNTSAR